MNLFDIVRCVPPARTFRRKNVSSIYLWMAIALFHIIPPKTKHPDNPRTIIAFLEYTNTNLMWNLSKMNCSAVNVYFVRDE